MNRNTLTAGLDMDMNMDMDLVAERLTNAVIGLGSVAVFMMTLVMYLTA